MIGKAFLSLSSQNLAGPEIGAQTVSSFDFDRAFEKREKRR